MKNYVITGSVGHISKLIVKELIKAGKNVSVISSSSEKVKEIESLGAKALVGSVNDSSFLKSAFKGADVVYTMIPPIWQTSNWKESQLEVARNYAEAIKADGIKYVVNLSSIGAHLGQGCGPVDALHDFEQMLNKIEGLNVKHLRPSYFYYNLISQIGLIKHAGIMGGNFGGGEDKLLLVHTNDIASAATEELLAANFKGNSVRNIASDARTPKELVAVLGKAIGKEIPWVVFSDDEQKQGLLQAGLSETHAQGYTDMGKALRTGTMQGDAINKPLTGKVKLEEFAKEFAAAFNAN